MDGQQMTTCAHLCVAVSLLLSYTQAASATTLRGRVVTQTPPECDPSTTRKRALGPGAPLAPAPVHVATRDRLALQHPSFTWAERERRKPKERRNWCMCSTSNISKNLMDCLRDIRCKKVSKSSFTSFCSHWWWHRLDLQTASHIHPAKPMMYYWNPTHLWKQTQSFVLLSSAWFSLFRSLHHEQKIYQTGGGAVVIFAAALISGHTHPILQQHVTRTTTGPDAPWGIQAVCVAMEVWTGAST